MSRHTPQTVGDLIDVYEARLLALDAVRPGRTDMTTGVVAELEAAARAAEASVSRQLSRRYALDNCRGGKVFVHGDRAYAPDCGYEEPSRVVRSKLVDVGEMLIL
jgi:hypothetical protein